MDRNSNQFPRRNNQPKMPRFNMNWIYIIVLIGLAVLFFTGGGDSLAQAAGTSKDAKYSDFKTYVEKGYAQRIVVNKNDNTLKMYVKPKYIQNVFQQSAQQTGNDPYVNVEFGSVDELDKYLAAEQAKGKFASYSYDNAKTSDIMSLIVEKGSIAIDGISLTVAKVSGSSFSVSIIPHTIEETILPDKRTGSIVNLETDIVGKYVRKMVSGGGADDKSEERISDIGLLDLL